MFHWIRLRAFIYATEDREKVIKAVKNSGISGEMKSEIAEGAYGDIIEIIEIKAKKNREIDAVFSSMSREDLKSLLDTVEDRVDDEGIFHFRLDKQALYSENFLLSSGGDVVSLEIKIKAYPSSREKAVEVMKSYLEDLI